MADHVGARLADQEQIQHRAWSWRDLGRVHVRDVLWAVRVGCLQPDGRRSYRVA